MHAPPSSPIEILARHFDVGTALPEGAERTLLEVLESVPDPRDRRGVRHGFAGILVIGICAVAAGARSFAAIAEWAADTARERLRELGIGVPDASTIRRALSRTTGEEFDEITGTWLAVCVHAFSAPDSRRRAVAVEGKTLRGARSGGDRAPGLMGCIDHTVGVVIGQVTLSDKSHEIGQFPVLLDQVGDIDNVVVTADALHTQRGHAEYLHAKGAHFVFTVKGNQKRLHQQLRSMPWADVPVGHTETDKVRGRIVTRTYKVITVTAGILFPHAVQAIRVTRSRKISTTGKRTRETVYAITSLANSQTDPAELADYLRGHWLIENKLHWVRDVTFDEDSSRIRTGGGPRMMASLRNLAISLLRLTGHHNIAQALRYIARDADRALKLLTTSPNTTLP
ncbi:ISAs1 family transposase [Rhodococcus opacus]|uniref:ISAs1 family transposase n=1 Tax=Rhodococcus opacus TaxID=37919 RepID=UPI001C469C33|nr:ISAs1 family transposase [Rhodococcus opacus]MBV6760555.1 ISAs1 family transposase [Rhodococcus opacus]